MSYVSLRIITKQNPRVDSQKIKKGETEHTTTENHQFTDWFYRTNSVKFYRILQAETEGRRNNETT